jgi:ABC-2 type transport system ATP-binding protein
VSFAQPTSPPNAPGYTNVVPATPANGTCRAGQIYSIYVLTPSGDTEAFTVFEPQTLCGGKTYPLVMWGPGYDGSRQQTLQPPPGTGTLVSAGNIGDLVAANYGVASIDERGFGNDTGTDRVMDPNFEGLMDLSVMDWAQANLPWLAYGPTLEGNDPHEPIMGSVGGSYGGMYQKMLLNIDKRHRLRAIVPQYSPNDLNYSLFPNGVIKSAWLIGLYGTGETGGSGLSYIHEDPFLTQSVETSLETNDESQGAHDFFGYHSSSYFCNGTSIATDGPGYVPLFPPNPPPKINALLFQGMRDTLFPFNNAYGDYQCWQKGGGDVRLLSFQVGHNTLQVVPDPYLYLYYSPTDDLDNNCGSTNVDAATTAFFNQYLKGMAGAANAIPTMPCLSIKAGDAVLVPSVTTGHAGTHFSLASGTVAVAGAGLDTPIPYNLGPAFTSAGVIGGLPRLEIDIAPAAATGEPILFFGIGLLHASQPTGYELLDNQLTPIRGAGSHAVDMTGIAARYSAGDQLALLIFGEEDQYDLTGSVNIAKPAVVPVTVTGDVWVPILGNARAAP